jgi:iron complex outermembrane receptor protein
MQMSSVLVTVGAIVMAASPVPVVAQQQTRTVELEEIIVTARKRDESLQDVPGAVTAVSGSYIDAANLERISDLIDIVPNSLVTPGGFALNDAILLRGVDGQLDFIEPGTGLYRDGFYIGGSRTTFSDFMDLARLEVLRGPQGALYGRNAVGGAVNFVYTEPELDDTSGRVEVTYGSHERVEGRGTLNLPIDAGRFAARLNVWAVSQDEGEYFNVTRSEYQDRTSNSGARLGLKWAVNENVDVVWTVERSEEAGPENYGAAEMDGETKETVQRDTPSRLEQDWTFLSQALTWDMAAAGTATALISHRDYDMNAIGDQDGFAAAAVQQSVIHRDEELSSNYAELRWLSPQDWRLGWLVGINYFDEDFALVRPVDLNFGGGAVLVNTQTDVTIDTQSYAAFAEATLKITDAWSANLSVRYTDDDKDFDFLRTFVLNGAPSPPIAIIDSRSFENTSLGGSISWQPTTALHFYFRANEGFRAGGYNTGFTGQVNDPNVLPYDPETSLNLEVGAKTTWFENRLRANLAVFQLEQDDLLQGVFINPNFFFKNVGKGTTEGVELDLQARPIENLDLIASFGYIRGELDEVRPSDVGGIVFAQPGDPIAGANTNNAYLGATYRIPAGEQSNVLLSANWKYQHNREPFASFVLGDYELQEYSIFNARIGYEAERWSVTAFGNNLSDDDYVISEVFYAPLGVTRPVAVRAPGRTYGLQVMAKF